ncbi:MAG: helix-turn-helix transcriptional regulator [Clostridia bacterium]|nr:helix-turn-helix transcriptional regulator [Clostridia bacterium]
MNVGLRIKELRERKGFTVNKLANLAGISQSYLRDVELGNKNPTVETLSYFCDALDISLQEFFSEKTSEINPFLLSAILKLSDTQQIKLAEFLNAIK